ncbi:MAG TPA: glycosyltransferase family 2 protein, partial [Candidatus Atribacteria bacterium]|nr:glycosyltransferase family 2 protein [Candidatus Atribacteria bacterium]
MENNLPISIIIPCRNEERFIGRCLDSIIRQDYFHRGNIEVLVIDGMSEDGTRKIIEKYIKQYPFIKLLNNKKKIIPSALNIGMKNAKGEIIIRMDAHTVYPPDYVSKCINFLNKYNADAVGGIIKTLPQDNTFLGQAIALSLFHPFGVGDSFFRIGCKEPRESNTIFSGCYKKEILNRVGFLDEKIEFSEDLIYNSKLKRAGAKLLLVPEIISYYYARSDFPSFCKH